MRTLIWFLYFWAALVALIPQMCHAQRLKRDGDTAGCDRMVQKWVYWWADSLLKLAGVRVTVSGTENVPNGPVVFVCNHQGNFDIPIVITSLPRVCGILAKKELTKLPLVRTWMTLMGCIFIDRKNPRQSVMALNEAIRWVEAGNQMVVFPEGTRSKGSEMREFKAGAFKIALKTGAPVVPVCIEGSYRIMEQNKNWIKPADVSFKILEPIITAGMDKETAKGLPERVSELIAQNKK